MKLKSIIISMVAAGAVSSSAFADTNNSTQAQLAAMQAQIAQMQATINANNAGTSLPTAGWADRISLGGMANIDGNVANRSPVQFNTHSPSSLAVSNANLFIDANISDWTKAHIGAVYASPNSDFNYLRAGAFDQAGFNSGVGAQVDEAYVTIGNFAKSPFYFKAGKEYLPFGSYKPYQDITPSFTQALSEVNDPAVETGFVANNGIHGNVFALQGLQKVGNNSSTAIRNMGLGLGLTNSFKDVAYDLGVQYLANMADVTAVRYDLTSDYTLANQGKYTNAVGAVAANAGVKFKAFDASAKYVGATKRFNVADQIYSDATQTAGAKPSAWGVDAGYSFPVRNHDSRIGLGYQGSRQAAYLWNPASNFLASSADAGGVYHMGKTRYLANYTVNVSKYTDLGFEVRHDQDYSVANGGTGRSANTGTVRLAVKFA